MIDSIDEECLASQFEAIFDTKESLISRFGQLAELRNAIRHSRSFNDVTMKDGQAALAWFRNIFDALDRAAPPPAPE